MPKYLYRSLVMVLVGLPACAPVHVAQAPGAPANLPPLARQVTIRRTTYGMPQILAENLAAAGFALAWVMLEDHGDGTIRGLDAARGRSALARGRAGIDADARALQRRRIAVREWSSLSREVRDMYDGFAAGMNHYIRVNSTTLPDWMSPDFTGVDILAGDVSGVGAASANAFVRRLAAAPGQPPLLSMNSAGVWTRTGGTTATDAASNTGGEGQDAVDDVGSNAWALAPSRTATGRAILLRNPHLSWNAGYYEAHIRVPGVLDFYGDFRIGGPFITIGGFNPALGFSTTNNASRSHEYYALRNDPARADAIVIDGRSEPLVRERLSVPWRDSTGAGQETREFLATRFGPVIHRDAQYTYIVKSATEGEARAGEQWLAMMRAGSLAEWQQAMRLGTRTTSNFTYADSAGNVMLVWMTGAPLLPHPAGGDTVAILAERSEQVWSQRAPFDQYPTVLNPPGGYVHNENDSPHYSNARQVLPHNFPFPVEAPALRFRSQHAIELLDNDRIFTLEDVVTTKHSMRMLLADRVKPQLLAALAREPLSTEMASARDLLVDWDNTVAAESRGGVLFEVWWNRYRGQLAGREPHAIIWDATDPFRTPVGLADPAAAREAFTWAVGETARRYGTWDVAWGEVNRVRRGNVDVPVGGCTGALGCFRVLTLSNAPDRKRVATGGDGWIIAVEFGAVPRAYSILAYGQSPDTTSAWHANQAALFANNQLKPVAWTEADIAAATIQRYHPGGSNRP
jgi:acyl-homoserine-lactone acylase